MNKIYIVDLTEEEQARLLNIVKTGKRSSRKINRARILLLADEERTDGEIAELHMDKTDSSNGEYWMRNTAEHRCSLEPSHSDEGVSSLSEILETGKVDSQYFLSPKACQGILRRAERREKELPDMLKTALEGIAKTLPQ